MLKIKKSSKLISMVMVCAIVATMAVPVLASEGIEVMKIITGPHSSKITQHSDSQSKNLGTDGNITISEEKSGTIDNADIQNIIDPAARGVLNGGSAYTSNDIYLTEKDDVLISITNTKDRDLFIGLKSVTTGKVYGETVESGNGTVTLTISTSENYKLYIENESTGSTNFTCDYVVE